MKILSLKAENVKRIQAIEINAKGESVILAGKNGQGKTSAMDAIWIALQYGRANRAMDHVVRNGQDSAESTVDLGDYVVQRRFTASGSTITVKDKEGRKFTSPQAILDGLIGNLAFDPLEFSLMEPDKQAKTLMMLAKLDLSSYVKKHEVLYEQRADANRKVKELIAQGKEMEKPGDDWPDAEISVAELTASLKRARAHEKSFEEKVVAIKGLEQEIAQLKEYIAAKEESIAALKNDLDKLAYEGPSTQELEAQFEQVEVLNKKARAKRAHALKAEEYHAAKAKADKLSEEIEENQKAKLSAIAGAEYPIEGLGVDPEKMTVTYRGQSWKDMSDGERLKVSAAMAMAMNPKLRVLFVRNAALLDDESLASLMELAKSNDYQLWVEVIKSDDPTAVQFVDGMIKEAK